MTITETVDNPTPYPIVTAVELPEVAELVEQARTRSWNPTVDVPWRELETASLPDDVRAAAASFWSLRAWMEHGAIPFGAERLRQAIAEHRPFEVKQHLVNFINEETRHFEVSYRIAESLDHFDPEPNAGQFEAVIPRFHDEVDERALSFWPSLFLNTLFEDLSGDLLADRYRNAENPAIKTGCRLILQDEVRHIRFGKMLMRAKVKDLSRDECALIADKFEIKLRHSLLRGVYATTNLSDDLQRVAEDSRRTTAEWHLGATNPDAEQQIIASALHRLRAEIKPLGIALPFFPEVGDVEVAA